MKTLFLLLFPILTFAQTMKFEIQGHRGSRGLMPENTIPAFKKAIDWGVQTLELDVVISKDKQVVIHCRSGKRSATVINALESQHGFTNLYNLKGGILAYIEEIGL